jgi:isocitrate dehydrogenase kinase/phosphatase
LLKDDAGVTVDAVLLTESDASRLFGYTRSYFHVLCRRPAAVVGFLKSILPVKPVAELYTSVGYSQHGKTNLFRALYRHMDHSNTRFERARGARGMVMAVFTLPSFDVVFKLIKDRFAPTKRTTPDDVKRRYKLVFDHDKAGRLVDAQEFENISFQRDRFDEDLLDELRHDCSRTVAITDDEVVLHHVYTERRLYPLDLYLREMAPDRARAAAIDYGYAVKDLASANIFPGDLFPKNFGVTRHGSVVFYDYDELCLLSDVNFRTVPEPRSYEDEMAEQPWFPVEPDDVFPEEFRTYLRSPKIVGEVFSTRHPEICTVEFWKGMQEQHASGELPDFFPYPIELRFGEN